MPAKRVRKPAAKAVSANSREVPTQQAAVLDLDPDCVAMAEIASRLLIPTQQSPNVVEAVQRAIKLYEEVMEQIAEWPPATGAAQESRDSATQRPRA
jgi:hypothetical protein